MKTENIAEVIGAIIAGIFTFYFYTNNETALALIACIVAFLLLFLFLRGILNKEEPFFERLNKILKTYDSILVEIECFPKLDDKKIVKAKYFKDLVNVQFDLRKPIYYFREEECCNFLILSSDSAYVYVLKKDKEYKSKLELLVDTQDMKPTKTFEIIENFDIQKHQEEKKNEEQDNNVIKNNEVDNEKDKVHFYKDLDPDELAMFNEVISYRQKDNKIEQENKTTDNNQTEIKEEKQEEQIKNNEETLSYEKYDKEETKVEDKSETKNNIIPTEEEFDDDNQSIEFDVEIPTEEELYKKKEKNNSNKKNKQLTIEKYEIDHINRKSNKQYKPYDDTLANLSEDELDQQFENLLNELNDLDLD